MFNARNTLVLRDLDAVTNYLKQYTHKRFTKDMRPYWPNIGKNILFQHYTNEEVHRVRIWNSTMFTSKMTENMNCFSHIYPEHNLKSNFIGALDYYINKNNLKLDYLNATTEQVRSGLLKYAENNARGHNINKLILDVHNDSKIYNKLYKKYDFYPNGKWCDDNPFYIEIEKKI